MATIKKTAPARKAPRERAATAALRVFAKQDGFRRAGRAWSGETVVPLSELTDEQIEQLENEPKLVVIETELQAEETPQAGEPDQA